MAEVFDLSEKLKNKREKEELTNPSGDIFGNEEKKTTLEEIEKVEREVDEKWKKAKEELAKEEGDK